LLRLVLKGLSGCSTSRFFLSTSSFCSKSCRAFFFQLLVCLLQFLLPALQFGCERLRLFQQIFRSRVRFNRVENDPDAFGQLIEKCLVRRIELFGPTKVPSPLNLALEEDR